MEAKEQRSKILKLNVLQTWVIIIGTSLGIVGAVAAWATGWMGLPERVKAVEQSQIPVATITNRVDTLEKSQTLVWQKLAADHDLLIGINQSLVDLKEQQREIKQDVKDLKK
jgi:hypothetical protein